MPHMLDVCCRPFIDPRKTINEIQENLERVQQDFAKSSGSHENHPVHNNLDLERNLRELFKKTRTLKGKMGVHKNSKYYTELKRIKWSVLSMQLGGKIDVDTLMKEENREFRRFIKNNKVHQIAIRRGITLPKIKDKPGVIFEGKEVSFDTLKKEAGQQVIDGNQRLLGSCITEKGVIKHWPYRPAEFKPFRQLPKSSDYQVEIVTAMRKRKGETKKMGHSFLRIRNPEGELYSFGLCGDLDYFHIFSFLKVKHGCFDNSDRFEDVSELDYDIMATPLVCTDEQAKMSFEIFQNLSKQEFIPFDLIRNNCVSAVEKILNEVLKEEVSFNSNARDFLASVFFSDSTIKFFRTHTPEVIKKVFRPFLNFILNFMAILLGANRAESKDIQPWAGRNKVRLNFDNLIVKDTQKVREWQEKYMETGQQ